MVKENSYLFENRQLMEKPTHQKKRFCFVDQKQKNHLPSKAFQWKKRQQTANKKELKE